MLVLITSNCQDISKLSRAERFEDRIQLHIKITLEDSNLKRMVDDLILTVCQDYGLECEDSMKLYLLGIAQSSFRKFRTTLVYFATRSNNDQQLNISYYK